MDAQLNCETCAATFNRYNLKQKYCSTTCRNKALYATRKNQLAKVEQLFSTAEELARSEERVKQLEAQLRDQKQENEALRAAIQQLAAQPTPSRYHIELRKMSITQVLDQPYSDYYLDDRGNKTISTDSIYLSSYSSNGALLSEQEIKGNDELLYLMERHNITDIELSAGL
jgi:septal ring factor EnvC (AmiA/AmiB activator)